MDVWHNQQFLAFSLLYTEKYLRPFWFWPFRPCCHCGQILDQFQCLLLFLSENNFVWVNSRWGKSVCRWRRAKKQGSKITLYTVLLKQFKIPSITLLFLQNITPLNCISIKWDRCYILSILSPMTQQTIL